MFRLSVESGAGNSVRTTWDRLHGLPGGKRLFSRMVGFAAPYTASIKARVDRVERGHAQVHMRDRPGLRNPFRSVHAIALANLAELTGNLAMAYSMPDDARFIVAGMEIAYVKKARGTITCTCDSPVPESSARAEYRVPVSLFDAGGDLVATATLRTLIGPKKV